MCLTAHIVRIGALDCDQKCETLVRVVCGFSFKITQIIASKEKAQKHAYGRVSPSMLIQCNQRIQYSL